MLLATYDDMLTAFGKEEIMALRSRGALLRLAGAYSSQIDPSNGQDEMALEKQVQVFFTAALENASSEALSYLAIRYPSFGEKGWPQSVPVPAVLKGAVCDIARFRLTGSGVTETEAARARYEKAVSWLQKIAAKNVSLPGITDEKNLLPQPTFVSAQRRFAQNKSGNNI